MEQRGSVNSNDRFFFAEEIVFRPCKEGFLVVSVPTANWLVLHSDFQKEVLQRLIDGQTVGEVYSLAIDTSARRQFTQLLAALTARDFARTDHAPESQLLEGYRMLNIYLTNACNLRCNHCFMRSGKPLKNELSANEWKRILSEFHKEGGAFVTFSGGEPLMNNDFDDILIHAAVMGLETTVLSNGILWTQNRITKLAPYISQIQISIDGFDETSNAKVRGAGHFDRIVNNVIAFANNGVRTSVATTFTFQNLQDDVVKRYADFVSDTRTEREAVAFAAARLKEAGYREFDPAAVYKAGDQVYFCNRISEVESYGNVKGLPLKPFMERGLHLHLQTSVDCLSPCNTCHLRYICGGGCRIDDCNFQGRLQTHEGPLLQVRCNNQAVLLLERKMIDSFLFYYTF